MSRTKKLKSEPETRHTFIFAQCRGQRSHGVQNVRVGKKCEKRLESLCRKPDKFAFKEPFRRGMLSWSEWEALPTVFLENCG